MLRIGQLLALGLTLISTTQASSSVLDLISDNFDEVVFNAGKPALVEFFAPWCGHCKNLAPVWEELAAGFSHASDKVTVAKVDADSEKDLGKRFGVQGFPTLKWFDEKNPKGEDYKGGRDLESLTKFITDKTGIKSKAKKAAVSNVEFLNDNTFSKQVGADKHVLVAFTAPWCGRKLSLAQHLPSFTADKPARLQVPGTHMGEARRRLRFRTQRADRESRRRSPERKAPRIRPRRQVVPNDKVLPRRIYRAVGI